MIVTLAGHVDHGKTSLVRALTGVDTDRLTEEKARGLTIDLGFAYVDEGRLGFVDVPGHHRFIHNMVAGVAANQVALLVIAADDGPMPQSREHLDILTLVGIERGVIAMTKCDRVDAARRDECEREIRRLVAGTFLEEAAVVPTSIEDSSSVEALLARLRDFEAADADERSGFRLAVDRAFNIRGSGLVVTGTIHSGTVSVDRTLHHFPSGTAVRVRGLRAQDRDVQTARAGERCAINLAGLDLDAITRGDWLTDLPREPALEITAEVSVLGDFPRELKHWTPVHVYHATSHTTARLALQTSERVAPGHTATVDLVCDEPLAVQHGDRLVLRDHSLDTTLGGGRVVFSSPAQTLRRRAPERLRTLQAYAQLAPQPCLEALLGQGAVALDEFRAVWQLDDKSLDAMLTDQGALRIDNQAITRERLAALAKTALTLVTEHQTANPSSEGLKENAFANVLGPFARQVLGALVQTKRLHATGGFYHLPQHRAALPDALQTLWQRVEPALDQSQPPSSGDLAKAWRIPQKTLETDLKTLSQRGYLVYLGDHRYFLPDHVERLAGEVKKLAAARPFSVREFRDHTGIGRNVAINVLEYFDAKGFTRREGNERVVLRPDWRP